LLVRGLQLNVNVGDFHCCEIVRAAPVLFLSAETRKTLAESARVTRSGETTFAAELFIALGFPQQP
jgi:hypothetical protein